MRPYNDPESHYQRHVQKAADRYIEGLRLAGLKSNDILTAAVFERADREAREVARRVEVEERVRAIQEIERRHIQRLNQIKRDGAKMRLMTCPLHIVAHGGVAWIGFSSGNIGLGVVCSLVALVFLCMLVGGMIFDRPQGE